MNNNKNNCKVLMTKLLQLKKFKLIKKFNDYQFYFSGKVIEKVQIFILKVVKLNGILSMFCRYKLVVPYLDVSKTT